MNFIIKLIAITLLIIPNLAQANIVFWAKSHNEAKAIVKYNLATTLRDSHKKSINSGFATFSLVKVEWVQPNKTTLIHQRSCTIKLDTWDEVYEVTKLEPPVYTATINKLDQYSNLCLHGEIDHQEFLDDVSKHAGKIKITLQIEQISSAQSAKIKEWLISQQSGLMQGLFSHMLGDLTQLDIVKLALDIPQKPEKLGMHIPTLPVLGQVEHDSRK